jgi:predicted NACHT family NTPase
VVSGARGKAKARTFEQKLRSNRPLQELATSPLLLTLLCLVFQERNDFDGTRAELYKQGLDVLLYKWDARRDIERDLPAGVNKSSLEPLLAELAYTHFFAGEVFFERTEIIRQIQTYFEKRNITANGVVIDASQVLNSIEAGIGLLVARSMDVYSFSHLTFQEYLTAQQVVRKPSLLVQIAPYVGRANWREVWLLLATLLDADDLVRGMKFAADLLIEKDTDIQKILRWCFQKANREKGHKAVASVSKNRMSY